MNQLPRYNPESRLSQRFHYFYKLGSMRDLDGRDSCPKGYIEKAGDAGLWFVEVLPKNIWAGMKEPRVVTVALTITGLTLNSFVFYPQITRDTIKRVIAAIPFVTRENVRFAAWFAISFEMISLGCRAFGRFNDPAFKDQFYPDAQV